MTNTVLHIPVAPGELIDKISILEIKSERMDDSAKLESVHRELQLLIAERSKHIIDREVLGTLAADLKSVNMEIWDLEDTIRECERRKDFGETFIATSRSIYRTNDRRAAIKKAINVRLGSVVVEEKSYADY